MSHQTTVPHSGVTVLAWNCAGNFSRKAPVVQKVKPDLVVLSEAEENAAEALASIVTGSAWMGEKGNRGLAVIGLNGWEIEPVSIAVDERLFLPVRAHKGTSSLQLIGVCAKKTTDYVTPTCHALTKLEPFIRSAPTVVAGDFNQSVVFDKRRSEPRQFRRVVDQFAAMGLRSAWHHAKNEVMGSESQATLYWRWSDAPRSRFHIDYLFAPSEVHIDRVEVGSYNDYVAPKLSDHVPLIVSLRHGLFEVPRPRSPDLGAS